LRVIVIGATGTIGSAVVQALSPRHEVVPVARSSGEHRVDISDKAALERLFAQLAPFDAIVSASGEAAFKPLGDLTDEDFQFSLSSKLMGQVNVVRVGSRFISDNGSITVTSGVLSTEPMPGSAAVSLVNAGLDGFTRAAALEMPRGIRVNGVSPPWVSETLSAMGMDPSGGMPAATVAAAYVQCVEGTETGHVIDARTVAR
jgi:NAD(P)-dependent dehydrogenase (short-subunit alcohol dehydrogenase family)